MRGLVVAAALVITTGAHAAPVASLDAPDGSNITLTDEQTELCKAWGAGKALRAIWTKPGETAVDGCYVVRDGQRVVIHWQDMDINVLPAQAFRTPKSI